MHLDASNLEATFAAGRCLGRLAQPGQCILLHGPLGAGKTHLARGIAEGARVADLGLVSSPTYVFLNIYPANPADPESKTVYHLDAYRAHGPEDLEALDLDELLDTRPEPDRQPGGLVVIEWPERLAALLPTDRLEVFIEPLDENSRRLEFQATGIRSTELLERYAKWATK